MPLHHLADSISPTNRKRMPPLDVLIIIVIPNGRRHKKSRFKSISSCFEIVAA